MTPKKLSPERLAEIRRWLGVAEAKAEIERLKAQCEICGKVGCKD